MSSSLFNHTPEHLSKAGVVIDVRADARVSEADVEAFTVTAQTCALLGWEFRRVGGIDPILGGNVRWLVGRRDGSGKGKAGRPR
ncbi:hypothetical protein [Nonomuraea sp. NPDC049480]|uniref:hypothetical protein n=1 Tax=Nonomuraea sp. NPDC049480 TaxID=3364353 RepID=UPI0037AE7DCC